MPVLSRSVRRGLVGLATLVLVAVGGVMLAGNMPVAAEKALSVFQAGAAPVPQLVAQVTGEKGARSTPAVGSESSTRTTKTFGGWTVVCNESGEPAQKVCSANFRVINQQNNANILVWLVGFNAEGELLSEFMTLTDVLIQPGVVVTLEDGEAVTAQFVECTTRGCKARLAMGDEWLEQLRSAANASIAMTRLDGQVIQFQMQVPGIDLALAELGV